MKMNNPQIFHSLLVLIIISFVSCGNWGWEDVTSDEEPQLNVFALVSLDTAVQSFVEVRRTIGLSGPEDRIIGKDTVWYGDGKNDYYIETIWASNFEVRDANVTISDGTGDYIFHPVVNRNTQYDYYDEDSRFKCIVYLDTLDLFHPEPNKTYFLTVTTPDGKELTGETVTPIIPDIYEAQIPDTINLKKTFTILWRPMDSYSRLTTDAWLCGGYNQKINEPGDSVWTSTVKYCDWYYEESDTENMTIELRAMDMNYYEYFIKHSGDDEFVSLLLGGGDSGLAFGVEGGYGVFGSIACDRVCRVAKR